jgi:hypothetical protein
MSPDNPTLSSRSIVADMSSHAIEQRLRNAGQLYRLARMLQSAREVETDQNTRGIYAAQGDAIQKVAEIE